MEIEMQAVAQAPIPIGAAVITNAGMLQARYVIHAPTMEQPAQLTDLDRIGKATNAALEIADTNSFKKIAIPGMGTGVGRVPLDKAADAMVKAIREFKSTSLQEVILIAFNDELLEAFEAAIN